DGNYYVVFTPSQPPRSERADIGRARFQSPGSDWQNYPTTPSAAAARSAWDGYSAGSSYLPGSAQPMPATNVTSPYSPGGRGVPISGPPVSAPPTGPSPATARGVRQIPAAAQVAPNPSYSGAVYPGGQVPARGANFQANQNPPAAGDSFTPAP